MKPPFETLEVPRDGETRALLHIQIVTEPAIPAPLERETTSFPTARQLDTIARNLAARSYTFPPLP